MKKRRLIAFGIVLIAGASVYFWSDRRSPYDFPPGPIVAYKLDGDRTADTGSAEILYSWPILQRGAVEQSMQARIRSAIADGRHYSRTGGYACFNPGMAFRIGEGDRAVDVLICLDCRQVYFYRVNDGEKARDPLSISDAGIASFGELYDSIFTKSKAVATRRSATIPTR